MGQIQLERDLFTVVWAGDEVEALRVTRTDGRGASRSDQLVDLGSTRLLHTVMDAPQETLPRTDLGLPVPPEVRVEAVDADGTVKAEDTLSPPLHGTGQIEDSGPAQHVRPSTGP